MWCNLGGLPPTEKKKIKLIQVELKTSLMAFSLKEKFDKLPAREVIRIVYSFNYVPNWYGVKIDLMLR